MKFITGMNRDRDGYQVAAAFAEVGALEALITDYYVGASWPRVNALEHRRSDFVDPNLVSTVPLALALQLAHRAQVRLPAVRAKFPSHRIDDSIAGRISRRARQMPTAGKFIYSNYAYRAFAEPGTSDFNGLFQYHPGTTVIREALARDELAGAASWESEPEVVDPRRKRIYRRETELATRIVCASNFTARGLVADGVALQSIKVVPYGCPTPTEAENLRPSSRMLLFVGQGVQRKGLHLLAEAWKRTRPKGWRLRVVASRLDPAIGHALASDNSIELTGAVSAVELERLYSTADALVLPSLVEGFGLVLGEALARGCRLIASTNTGLPDLELEDDIARTVVAGSVESLVQAIGWLTDTYHDTGHYRESTLKAAQARGWHVFRSGIRESVATAMP